MAIKKPFFICFEGVEGSGKSTQAELLFKFIKKNITKNVILTREPGGTLFSEKIRNLLLDKKTNISPIAEFFLLMAARNEHVINKINFYLKKNFIIICDRFFYSTLAYQHYLEGMDKKFIFSIQKKIYNKIHPDITFLIDLNNKESKTIINNRSKKLTDLTNFQVIILIKLEMVSSKFQKCIKIK